MNNEFWVVWNPQHGNPQFRHAHLRAAQQESERLARAHPGDEFYVLHALSVTKKTDVLTVRLDPVDECVQMPF